MRQRTRILVVALACALLVLFAYSPLLQAGLLGEDVRILVEAPDAEPLGPGPLARLSVVASRDLWGVEMYYNVEITPWFHLTPDLQIAQNEFDGDDTAVILGIRGVLDF